MGWRLAARVDWGSARHQCGEAAGVSSAVDRGRGRGASNDGRGRVTVRDRRQWGGRTAGRRDEIGKKGAEVALGPRSRLTGDVRKPGRVVAVREQGPVIAG